MTVFYNFILQVYKQKVKHLLYEHQNNITELKQEGECVVIAVYVLLDNLVGRGCCYNTGAKPA